MHFLCNNFTKIYFLRPSRPLPHWIRHWLPCCNNVCLLTCFWENTWNVFLLVFTWSCFLVWLRNRACVNWFKVIDAHRVLGVSQSFRPSGSIPEGAADFCLSLTVKIICNSRWHFDQQFIAVLIHEEDKVVSRRHNLHLMGERHVISTIADQNWYSAYTDPS